MTKQSARTLHRRTWRVGHVVTACLGLGSIFAVGFYVAAATRTTTGAAGSFGPPAPVSAAQVGLRTATIWLAPDPNDQCRQLIFDNFEGSIRDQGRIHCNDTFSQPGAGSARDGMAGQHMQSVRQGFTRR